MVGPRRIELLPAASEATVLSVELRTHRAQCAGRGNSLPPGAWQGGVFRVCGCCGPGLIRDDGLIRRRLVFGKAVEHAVDEATGVGGAEAFGHFDGFCDG